MSTPHLPSYKRDPPSYDEVFGPPEKSMHVEHGHLPSGKKGKEKSEDGEDQQSIVIQKSSLEVEIFKPNIVQVILAATNILVQGAYVYACGRLLWDLYTYVRDNEALFHVVNIFMVYILAILLYVLLISKLITQHHIIVGRCSKATVLIHTGVHILLAGLAYFLTYLVEAIDWERAAAKVNENIKDYAVHVALTDNVARFDSTQVELEKIMVCCSGMEGSGCLACVDSLLKTLIRNIEYWLFVQCVLSILTAFSALLYILLDATGVPDIEAHGDDWTYDPEDDDTSNDVEFNTADAEAEGEHSKSVDAPKKKSASAPDQPKKTSLNWEQRGVCFFLLSI